MPAPSSRHDHAAATVDPVLASAQPGDLVGIEVSCPRYDCGWREPLASAEVVNEYGVRDPLPKRCRVHGLPVVVDARHDCPVHGPEIESAASVTDEAKRLLAGLTPEQRALLDRCTCDLARPYWHSFHREGCPLAR